MAAKSSKYKPFRQWNADDVEEVFRLQQVEHLPQLQEWLNASESITQIEQERLEQLRERLAENVNTWNEEELKLKFIAQILELVDYDVSGCTTFADRTITTTIEGKVLSGTVDVLIARGKRVPKAPLLCIHEYKKERGSSDDPLGQVLVAMLVAQSVNSLKNAEHQASKQQKPVYGAYAVGRLWFLLVLHASSYAVSEALNAADSKDIRQLYRALKHFRTLIPSLLA